MSKVLVHKAVEPDKLTAKGRKRYDRLVESVIQASNGALVQPKHDGVYAQFIFDEEDGWKAFSRTGENLKSVSEEILDVFYTKGLQDARYMGELWLPNTAHNEINGRSRKHSPQYLNLILFDSVLDGQENMPYRERLDFLLEGNSVVKPVSNLPVGGKIFSEGDLYDMARDLVSRGSSAYDGLMLKDANGVFVPGAGRDGEAIKIKPRASGSFRVVGVTKGLGNRAGGIGALILDLGGGVTGEVGAGLSMADVFDRDFIGKIVEVEYLSVTKDGRLREPAYKVIRNDVTEPDVLEGNIKSGD